MARALGEAKGGHGLRRLVVVGREQVVKARVADGLHEPFSGLFYLSLVSVPFIYTQIH